MVCDVPDLGLVAGEVGAVVKLLSDDAFEVEFVDDTGYTYGAAHASGESAGGFAYQRARAAGIAQGSLNWSLVRLRELKG